jgi:antitoxin component HigA of HigAB toxin-antitoxin module
VTGLPTNLGEPCRSSMIDRLLARDALPGDEQDYLDVLSDLVEKYEDQRYPIERVSGLDALRHLVESSGKLRATVAAEAGLPESTLKEVQFGRCQPNSLWIAQRLRLQLLQEADPERVIAPEWFAAARLMSVLTSRVTTTRLALIAQSKRSLSRVPVAGAPASPTLIMLRACVGSATLCVRIAFQRPRPRESSSRINGSGTGMGQWGCPAPLFSFMRRSSSSRDGPSFLVESLILSAASLCSS